jgi:hypothetical protein
MDLTGLLNDAILEIASWMKDYSNEIVLSIVATLLVIYGDAIMKLVKRQIGGLNKFVKISIFIGFCGFGFSFLTGFASPIVSDWLASIDSILLPFVVVSIFYILGYLAQRKSML